MNSCAHDKQQKQQIHTYSICAHISYGIHAYMLKYVGINSYSNWLRSTFIKLVKVCLGFLYQCIYAIESHISYTRTILLLNKNDIVHSCICVYINLYVVLCTCDNTIFPDIFIVMSNMAVKIYTGTR